MQLILKAEITSHHMMLIFKKLFPRIKLQGSQTELSRVKLGKENGLPTVARWGHCRFEFHSSKFLQCKSHIFPVQISSANLTFLLCKSFLQYKSCISPVQILYFSSANPTFLQFKSHISPVQISLLSRTFI